LVELDCATGRRATSANAKRNVLVLNGDSSLRELSAIVSGFASFSSQRAVDETGRALLTLARQALLSRDVKALDETVLALLALPLDARAHAVARYYRAYSAYALRKSEGSDQTRLILERLSDSVLPEYRPRALLALGNCYASAGDQHKSTKIYMEAGRAATGIDPFTKCQAIRALALLRSCDGDHNGSLADLERLFPVMRSFAAIYPEDYRYYLNNLAYELGEVGRIDEAKAAINVALRSPYADRFPDWAETAQELETKRRRVFLPLVFALGSPAALAGSSAAPSIPAIPEEPAAAVAQRERLEPEAAAPVQPESQPDLQIATAQRKSLEPKRNRNSKSAVLVVLALLSCRRLDRVKPLRQSQQPTFEARGCAKSPPARAPPYNGFLFF
jgi:tetratricopeptide (TPR) repeat protein